MTTPVLRPWRGDDIPFLVSAYAAPDMTTQGGPLNASDLRALLPRLAPTRENLVLAIEVDGEPVGQVAVTAIDTRHLTGWVSYWSHPNARGRGHVARAVATLARFAFDELGLERLELGHRVNNPASGRVAEKAGFVAEGVERQKLKYGDERFDVRTMARLVSDPQPELALGAIRVELPGRAASSGEYPRRVSPKEYAADLSSFVTAAPSSFHAAAEVARRLEGSGFTRIDESAEWPATPGRYVLVRDGAAIGFIVPEGADALTPFSIVGAHTDSPTFVLKPTPQRDSGGVAQALVEVYGGAILASWLDRELLFAGRLALADGREVLARTEAIGRIPSLAIHLDRSVNDGLTIDRQRHTQPVIGLDLAADALLTALAESADVEVEDIRGYDVCVADSQPGRLFGLEQEFFASGRLDNLSSVHAGVRALEESEPASTIPVLAAFDHEEIGSGSRSGAAGPILEDVLRRISASLGGGVDEWARQIRGSWCVSSDAGHAVHPNYADRHDPDTRPVLGGGPLLKINANQRYTTDAPGAARWSDWAAQAGSTWQPFVSNNDVPCGSTIGPITATRLGIRTVDVGTPLLSMHSAREMCAIDDTMALSSTLGAFFSRSA